MVEAVLRGMPKAEAARTFGIGISTVKRYVGKAHKGEDLAPRRPPGKRRTLDEGTMRLLESDLKERPALTLSQRRSFLERVVGAQVSESTISRAIKRLGWSRNKDREYCDRGARDVSPYWPDPKKVGFVPFHRSVDRFGGRRAAGRSRA